MPQIQMLPKPQDFGTQLAKVLSQAGADIGKGLVARHKYKLEKQKELNKFEGDIHKNVESTLKYYNINPETVNRETKEKLKKDALNLYAQTKNPNAAIGAVENYIKQEKELETQAKIASQSFLSRILTGEKPTGISPKKEETLVNKILQTFPQFTSPTSTKIGQQLKETPARQEIGGIPIEKIPSHLTSYLAQTEAYTPKASKEIGEMIKSNIAGRTFGLSEKMPGMKVTPTEDETTKLFRGLSRKGGELATFGAAEKYLVAPAGEKAGEMAYNLAKNKKVLKSLGTKLATKFVIRGGLGSGIKALENVIENEPIKAKDLAKNGLMYATIGSAFDILGDVAIPLHQSLANIAKKQKISTWEAWKQFGQAVKNRGYSFVKGKSNPATPTKILEIGNEYTSVKSLPKELESQVKEKAQKFNIKPETVAQEARGIAQEQGIDLNAVENNEPQAISAFGRIVTQLNNEDFPKEKKVFRETEKAPISKQSLVERKRKEQTLVRKAAKSPLEVYYEPKPEVQHRPETIAKKKVYLEDVDRREKEVNNKILDLNDIQLDLEGKIKESSNPSEISKMKKDIDKIIDQKLEQQKELHELTFERYQGKRRPTELEITGQIANTFDKMKENIRNPQPLDAKKIKQIKAQAERDRKAIELAQQLIKRGELLSDLEARTFRTIKEQYQDAYKEMKKINDEIIEDVGGSKNKAFQKEVEIAKQMNKILETRIKVNQASIVKDNDVRSLRKLSKGAKGAFFRKSLGDLRKDVEFFQNQMFKQNRIKTQLQLKTEKIKTETFNKFLKNPTPSNIKKSADAEGINYNTLKREGESLAKEMIEKEEPMTEKELKEKIQQIHDKLEEKGKEKSKPSAEKETKKEETKTKESKIKEKEKVQFEKKEKERKNRIFGLMYETIRFPLRMVGFRLPPWRSIQTLKNKNIITPYAATSIATALYFGGQQLLAQHRVVKFRKLKKRPLAASDYENELRRKGVSKARINKLKNQEINIDFFFYL